MDPLITNAEGEESENTVQSQQDVVNTQQRSVVTSTSSGEVSETAVVANKQPPGAWRFLMQLTRQRNLKVCRLPMAQKMVKLSMYSTCQAVGCHCMGWKISPEDSGGTTTPYWPNLSEICSCRHSVQSHIAHLEGISDLEINKLMIAIIDMEKLYADIRVIDDRITKIVYSHIARMLRYCVLSRQAPATLSPSVDPQFETPTISKAVTSFLYYRYNRLSHSDMETMILVARTFLNFVNYYKFQVPSMNRAHLNATGTAAYEINYARWLLYCRLPIFHHSLRRYETKLLFGRSFLTADFQIITEVLEKKCVAERDMFTNDKKCIISQMPIFLNALKEELVKDGSPIWDPSYEPPTTSTFQPQRRQLQDACATTSTGIVCSSAVDNESGEPVQKKAKLANIERDSK